MMQSIQPSAIERRPPTIIAAIVLLVILAAFNLVPPPADADIPQVMLIMGFIVTALKVIAAIGLWWSQK